MKAPTIGDVLIQNTCDAIEFGLDGKHKRINEHDEHWLVEAIGTWGFKLYNLDTQRTWTMSRMDLNIHLSSGLLKQTNIKA